MLLGKVATKLGKGYVLTASANEGFVMHDSEADTPTAEAPQFDRSADDQTYRAGWYPVDGGASRFFDGSNWTDSYSEDVTPFEGATNKEVLWGVALGFGATGGIVGAIGVPILAFYFPLGFGAGGLALCIAAGLAKGNSPWWAAVAIIGSLAALATGIDAYNEFSDINDSANNFRLP